MVKEQLTDAMIDAGAMVMRKLDDLGLDVRSALWMYDVEIEEWRLLFAAPEVETEGPQSVYKTIGRAVDELGADAEDAPFSVIQVLDVNADLYQRLKGAVRFDPERKGKRLRKTVVNGKYIDDALVYRAA